MQRIKRSVRNYLRAVFTLDLRALALLRIFLAIVLIGDISVRLSDVEAFYSNFGVLPLGIIHQGHFFGPLSFSFHAMNGSIWFQTVLFLLAYVFAFCMLIGHRTRLFTFLSFLMLWSVQNRNTLVLQGGDDLLRLCLFWAILMPIGKLWSLDSFKEKKPEYTTYFSWGNVGYIMLLFSVYFFTALMKHSAEWYSEGTALYYALSIDQMAYPLSKLIYPYPSLLKFLTFSTIYLELIAPFLLLIPAKNSLFRMLYIVSLTTLHIGIGLTMQVGYFFIISIVAMIGIWPDRFLVPFQKIANWFATTLPLDSLKQWVTSNVATPNSSIVFRKSLKPMAIIGILVSLVWNIGNISKIPDPVRTTVKPMGKLFGLSQNWGMFAPTVYKADGWFVYEGITYNGDTIDILKPEEPMSYDKPQWVVYQFKNAKWRKLGENLIRSQDQMFRSSYAKYHLKKHNKAHPNQQIETLNVLYFREKTLLNYEVEEIEKGKICSYSLPKEKENEPRKTETTDS